MTQLNRARRWLAANPDHRLTLREAAAAAGVGLATMHRAIGPRPAQSELQATVRHVADRLRATAPKYAAALEELANREAAATAVLLDMGYRWEGGVWRYRPER